MAAHASILAWRIPRTEEPGDYSPLGREALDTTEQLTPSHMFNFSKYPFRSEIGWLISENTMYEHNNKMQISSHIFKYI